MYVSTIILIHAEAHQKNHVQKHFADGQLTTVTKSQYNLYTHILRLHEIVLVVVQHMSKTKYVISYVIMSFLHCIRRFSFSHFFSQNIFHHFRRVLISCDQLFHILFLLNDLFTEDNQILKNSFTN